MASMFWESEIFFTWKGASKNLYTGLAFITASETLL